VVSLRCVSDSLALLVTDGKGRINFATSQLAGLLGYSSAKVLTDGMNLAGLLPLPYSQLHSGFMKVRARRTACTLRCAITTVCCEEHKHCSSGQAQLLCYPLSELCGNTSLHCESDNGVLASREHLKHLLLSSDRQAGHMWM
jgi:hypothetical protein